jgi:DNA-binding Lrp family transcriptional regulator
VTVLSRIKKLEKAKIIKGYTSILNHEKLGYDLTAVIEIIAKKDKIVQVENELSDIENVCAVYDVTGNTDTLIIAKFKGREDLSKFIKNLSSILNVENTITHVVLNTVKEDFRLT